MSVVPVQSSAANRRADAASEPEPPVAPAGLAKAPTVSRSMTSAPTSPTRTPICLKGISTARQDTTINNNDQFETPENCKSLIVA